MPKLKPVLLPSGRSAGDGSTDEDARRKQMHRTIVEMKYLIVNNFELIINQLHTTYSLYCYVTVIGRKFTHPLTKQLHCCSCSLSRDRLIDGWIPVVCFLRSVPRLITAVLCESIGATVLQPSVP